MTTFTVRVVVPAAKTQSAIGRRIVAAGFRRAVGCGVIHRNGLELGAESVTVKVRFLVPLLPSVMLTSLMVSAGVGSSLRMVPRA